MAQPPCIATGHAAVRARRELAQTARHDAWQAGDSYDQYMGRWSRQVAPEELA